LSHPKLSDGKLSSFSSSSYLERERQFKMKEQEERERKRQAKHDKLMKQAQDDAWYAIDWGFEAW